MTQIGTARNPSKTMPEKPTSILRDKTERRRKMKAANPNNNPKNIPNKENIYAILRQETFFNLTLESTMSDEPKYYLLYTGYNCLY